MGICNDIFLEIMGENSVHSGDAIYEKKVTRGEIFEKRRKRSCTT